MRPLKSFIASAALAASTLGFVAVSAPAQACTSCGGIKLNGTELNGMRMNGWTLNGWTLNGLIWNGFNWNGLIWNGLQLNGVPVPRGTAETPAKIERVLAVTLPR